MKQILLATAIIFITAGGVFAQKSIDSLLVQIEQNNTTLAAIRKSVDAEKMGNKTGLSLQNPEFEFHYLWGNPSAIGNRTDIEVSQSLDFPTAYVYRNQLADLKNEQAELEYKRQRLDIFLQVRILCAELTYQNALHAEYQTRYENARQLARSVKTKAENGEANILDENKAKVTLLNTEAGLKHIEIERQALLQQLATLNGGIPVDYNNSAFQTLPINTDFEQWTAQAAAKNPVLNWLEQEIEVSNKNTQLETAKSHWLPQ